LGHVGEGHCHEGQWQSRNQVFWKNRVSEIPPRGPINDS
jgi:hypothetical protein